MAKRFSDLIYRNPIAGSKAPFTDPNDNIDYAFDPSTLVTSAQLDAPAFAGGTSYTAGTRVTWTNGLVYQALDLTLADQSPASHPAKWGPVNQPYSTNLLSLASQVSTSYGRSLLNLANNAALSALVTIPVATGSVLGGVKAGSNVTISPDGTLSVQSVTGALLFKGAWDASAGTFPSGSVLTGWFYRVSVAGTVNGIAFSVGDDLFAIVDAPSTTVFSGNWTKIEGGLTLADITNALGFTPLNAASNLSDLANAGTARTNLGLGTASTVNTGTTAGTVPVLTTGGKYPALDGSLITNLSASGTTNLTVVYASGTFTVNSSSGTGVTVNAATGSLAGALSSTDKTKLDGIANAATANATDAQLRDRSTHTGTQAAGTITGLGTAATVNTGTTSGTIPVLTTGGKYPALDGSLITNLNAPTPGLAIAYAIVFGG